MKPIKKKQGFTIVELVIVVGVISILAAILIPTFINLNNKAQVSSNQSFVKNLNTQMAIREQEEGKNNTMFEAVKDAKDIGFDVEKLTPVDNRDLVWDSRSDRFALLNSDGSVFFSEGNWELKAGDEHKIWKIYASMPAEQQYSIYAKEGWEGTEVSNLQVGFDVGNNEGFESISYVGKSYANEEEVVAKTVTIRTNGADTTLTVNNAADTVYHYDLLGKADIVKTAENSFHEFGKSGYAQIASGRLVAEKGGYINSAALVGNAVLEIKAGGVVENKYASSADYITYNNAKEGAYQFPADAVRTAAELETIAENAIKAVTPDPYERIVKDGLAIDAKFAVLKEDKTLYGYELPSVLSDQQYTILMIQDYVANDWMIFINGSNIVLDLNGTNLTYPKDSDGIGAFTDIGAHLTVTDNKGTGSISLPEIVLLGGGNTIAFKDVDVIFNGADSEVFSLEGNEALTFDGGTYTFDTSLVSEAKITAFKGMLGFNNSKGKPLQIKECDINVNPENFVAAGYEATQVGDIWQVRKK